MPKITTVLFDFDGVIADTEPQYDIYTNNLGEKYQLGIPNFAAQVKGTTTPDIIKKYFSHLSTDEAEQVLADIAAFEEVMDFPEIPGVTGFMRYLKDEGYKVGLVTSSQQIKMKRALDIMGIADYFDTLVTADRITTGKPHPMCYQLAAKDLEAHPSECLVFEDSFHGIAAGKAAGMRVVGLSTTIPAEKLEDKADAVIADFSDRQLILSFLE